MLNLGNTRSGASWLWILISRKRHAYMPSQVLFIYFCINFFSWNYINIFYPSGPAVLPQKQLVFTAVLPQKQLVFRARTSHIYLMHASHLLSAGRLVSVSVSAKSKDICRTNFGLVLRWLVVVTTEAAVAGSEVVAVVITFFNVSSDVEDPPSLIKGL